LPSITVTLFLTLSLPKAALPAQPVPIMTLQLILNVLSCFSNRCHSIVM